MVSFGDILKPTNGYTIRTRMMTERLSETHIVDVFQFVGPSQPVGIVNNATIHSISVEHEKKGAISFLERLIGFDPVKSFRFQYDNHKKLKSFSSLIEEADEAYVEGCLLVGSFLKLRKAKIPIILDTHCINEDVAIKLKRKSKLKGGLRQIVWHALESFMISRSQEIIVVSENDKNFIVKHHHIKNPISVIPNEVPRADLKIHKKDAERTRNRLLRPNFKAIALFIGDLGAIQNKDALDYIVTKLAPNHQDTLFVCVGNNPDELQSKDNISFTGFVDNLDAYIVGADVCIAPMSIGSGTKTKVLDYMKYDKQIIATDVGLEGIDVGNKDNIKRANLDIFSDTLRKVISV